MAITPLKVVQGHWFW